MTTLPLLSSIILCPLFGALFILLLAKDDKLIKIIALTSSLAALIFSAFIYSNFDKSSSNFQLQEMHNLIKSLNMHYHLGVDGISIFFVILTAILTPLCILASWQSIKFRVKEYMIAFLLLETMVIGVFCALDFVLFYIF